MYLGNIPQDQYLSVKSQQITGNGGSSYTLDYAVSTSEEIAVFVNNVRQNVSTYSVSSTTLTLGGTISASDSCWVLFLGRTVGTKTPAVGSITNDMLQNSSITLNGSAVSLGGSATVGGNNTPAFQAYRTGSFNLTNSTTTLCPYNTEAFDTDSCYDTSTYRFTPTTAGKYYVYHEVGYGRDTSNVFNAGHVTIYKNGTRVAFQQFSLNTVQNYMMQSVSTVIDMNGTTDYLEAYILVAVNSGTPRIDPTEDYCRWGAFKLIGV